MSLLARARTLFRPRQDSAPEARAPVVRRPKKIVVLGMMTRHPVAGIVWLTMQYVIGLARLGYEVYYVEAHGGTPKSFMREGDDGAAAAAAFLADVFERFDLRGRWAYQALHSDQRCYGLSPTALDALYRDAALIFNLHGGTTPRQEHVQTGRLVYVGTDPVEREIALQQNDQEIVDLFAAHAVFFTWATNYGRPDSRVPVSNRFNLIPTRQPIVLDFWRPNGIDKGELYTTVGSWRQLWRDVTLDGEAYGWSKHHEFLKFLDLPRQTGERFELALAGCDGNDRALLEQHGWHLRDGLAISADVDDYRDYIFRSYGEFTVAKDQNVRLRSGWFSDRSASYLAAGRPVVTQDTGFGSTLPVGAGLFAFSTMDDVLAALDAIRADYDAHSRAAAALAQEWFRHDVVLPHMLAEAGL